MGIPLLQGRDFTDDDSAGHPGAAIVSRSFARKYFPGQSALGKRFRFGDDSPPDAWWTIVGVVGDVRYWKLDARTADAGLHAFVGSGPRLARR